MSSPEASSTGLSHRQILQIFAGLMLGLFLAALDQTIVSAALPKIVEDLGDVHQLTWVVISYMLTSTASTPLWGKLGDLFGRRIVFQAAIVTFIVGSAACGFAQTMLQLVLARALQGIGGGGLFALAFAIVADVVSPRERGRYIGYFTAVFASAGLVGPLAGGVLTDTLNWRWIFTMNLPLGLIALVVTSRVLKLPFPRRKAKLDLLGAGLLVASVSALILVSVWGGERYPWGSAQVLLLTAAGVALGVAFVGWEARASEPIVPLRLFRNPVVGVGFLLSFLVGSMLFSSLSFLPLYMQGAKGVTATQSGLLLSPQTLGMSLTSIIIGRAVSRSGRYKSFIVTGTGLFVAVMFLLSRIEVGSSWLFIGGVMLLVGVGIGLSMPILSTATQNAVEVRDLGAATGALTFFRNLGGSFGIAAYGAVFTARLTDRLEGIAATKPLPEGITASNLANGPEIIASLPEPLQRLVRTELADSVSGVFVAATAVALAAFAVSWLLREIPLRGHTTLSVPAQPAPEGAGAGVGAGG
jgi:EmrB/QacA subfamily drug resistance transporter